MALAWKKINRCNSWDRGCGFVYILIITNHMYVVLLGSNPGKAKEQISLMQNLDQKNLVLAQFLRQTGVGRIFFYRLRIYKAELFGCGWKGAIAIKAPGPITRLLIYRTRLCSSKGKPIGEIIRHKVTSLRWETAKLCSQLSVEDASHNRVFWETRMAAGGAEGHQIA